MCACVFAMCIRMWECTQKPFEVPHSLYTPLPHVSSPFEDHVAMINKVALFPLQTYGMNMDMIWHQTFNRHFSLHSRAAVWWSLIGPAISVGAKLVIQWLVFELREWAFLSSYGIAFQEWYRAAGEHCGFLLILLIKLVVLSFSGIITGALCP